jgi:hypothetical protein
MPMPIPKAELMRKKRLREKNAGLKSARYVCTPEEKEAMDAAFYVLELERSDELRQALKP